MNGIAGTATLSDGSKIGVSKFLTLETNDRKVTIAYLEDDTYLIKTRLNSAQVEQELFLTEETFVLLVEVIIASFNEFDYSIEERIKKYGHRDNAKLTFNNGKTENIEQPNSRQEINNKD